MNKIYFHIDVNNAFLSWEAKKKIHNGEKLDIRNVASAIAGDPKKRTGVILAKSKIAKEMGVKTGEAIFTALKKCPTLLLYPPHHDYYEKQSNLMKKFLENYSDTIQQYSIDEFFIEYIPLLGTYMDVANHIKDRIKKELGFTVNIGISDTKYLAKIASDFEKPDKIHTLFKSEIKSKLWKLPIEQMFLLGPSTSKKLRSMGIDTIGKLANTDIHILSNHFKSHGIELYNFAWGKDIDEKHQKKEVAKSISHSKTSINDLTSIDEINTFLLDVVNDTSVRLRKENMKTKNVSVTLKTNNFNIYSSTHTLSVATNSTKELYNTAKNILNGIYKGEPLRLIGVGFSNLESSEQQINFFDSLNENIKNTKIDSTIDKLLEKFNDNKILTRASLISKK